MALSEATLRQIVQTTRTELGAGATAEAVEAVVRRVVAEIEAGEPGASLGGPADGDAPGSPVRPTVPSERALVTAFGRNGSGIMAALSGTLSRYEVDVLDVQQRLMQGFFTLIMLIDLSRSGADVGAVRDALQATGERLGIRVLLQHEDLFRAMHRI